MIKISQIQIILNLTGNLIKPWQIAKNKNAQMHFLHLCIFILIFGSVHLTVANFIIIKPNFQ